MRCTVAAFGVACATLANAAAPELTTLAERTNNVQTGRYAEVQALCAAMQKAYPTSVRCWQFGTTPQGRPMLAIIASKTGALTPADAHQRHLPVVLVQGGIHAGEIDGKDAGLLALRDALDGKAAKGALDKQVLVFVPVFNIDGHERFGAWNRPNQRGPQAMGWRTTAQNLNLNRDYAKADTPEMQAMLGLVNLWDPLVNVDLHVTDGAKFEHDISIQVEPAHAGDATLLGAGSQLRDGVISALASHGALPLPFYMSFDVEDDPSSGFSDEVSKPRFSHGYYWLRNRFGMLVETHSWKDYPTRVRLTYNSMVSVLEQVGAQGAQWLKLANDADAQAANLAGKPVVLTYQTTKQAHTIDFRGYAYTRTPSDVSGALMTRYDESTPQVWHVPLRDQIVPALTVVAPRAGYLVPVAHAAWVAQKLAVHGIQFETLGKPLTQQNVEAFRAEQVTFAPKPTEGHHTVKFQGAWRVEPRTADAGALFVPIAQPKARLLMSLLEPQAPDSLAAWGMFDNAFEAKEYMEDYVAEDVARAQMAADPQLAETFRKKLAEDATFAKDPAARLAFFARRHASWDEQFNLYPVLRTDTLPR